MALTHAALLHQCCREVQASYERAEAIIALCSEQRLPYWLETGIVLRGWALAEQGREGEGMAEMRRGLAAYRTVDIEQGKPHLLAMVAEVEGKVGQIEEGLALVAEALAFIDRTEERYYEAELYRLKGELLLRQAEKLRE
jgi:predicted ATPase